MGDVEGDGYADIVTGATVGNPHVRVYSGLVVANGGSADDAAIGQFFAYGLQYDIGVNVAVADVEGDGHADIITGASQGSPHVKVYSGKNFASYSANGNLDADVIEQFFAADGAAQGGVTVGAASGLLGVRR